VRPSVRVLVLFQLLFLLRILFANKTNQKSFGCFLDSRMGPFACGLHGFSLPLAVASHGYVHVRRTLSVPCHVVISSTRRRRQPASWSGHVHVARTCLRNDDASI
jgi:hypothetical protein